jgi:[protein-PII] uridylyltransferase
MSVEISNRDQFTALREVFFQRNFLKKNALNASMEFSLLIEEQIHRLAGNKKYNFALVSTGSFSRRELSPFSDIDLMFITRSVSEVKNEISELIQNFWDNGIDVSHTVREFSDIQKFLETDLHTFTIFDRCCSDDKICNGGTRTLFRHDC